MENIQKKQDLIKALNIPGCKGSHVVTLKPSSMNTHQKITYKFAAFENFQNSRSAKLCTAKASKMFKYRCHKQQKKLSEVTEQKHKHPYIFKKLSAPNIKLCLSET